MKKNRIIMVGLLVLAIIVSAIGITSAYLTDRDTVTNTFTVGDLRISLTEPNWEDGDGDGEVPGDTLVKDPTVLAEENDCYVRFVVRFIDTQTGKVITDQARANKIAQTMRYDATYDSDNGTPGTVITADGSYSLSALSSVPNVNPDVSLDSELSSAGTKYYCFEEVLEEGDLLTLFTNIVIPTDWSHDDMALLGSYKIEVSVEAIQAANFESSSDAFDALNIETASA